MSSLLPSDFNQILDQLKNYGQRGSDEILFKEKNGNLIPTTVEKPNWFFRLVRWLFQGGYQEATVAKRIVEFLETNHTLLINKEPDVTALKTIFLKKVTNLKDRNIIEKRFNALIPHVQVVASSNQAFNVKSQKAVAPVVVPLEAKQASVQAQAVASVLSIAKKPPEVIDVPDDGNCLFYALAVGLRKIYEPFPDIQRMLQWEVNPEHLTGDLSKAYELLKTVGARLREQAAKSLEANQFDEEIMVALLGGMGTDIEVIKKKIEDEEAVTFILKADIEELRKQPQTSVIKEQLKEKEAHLKNVEESIVSQRAKIPHEDDLAGYINFTKEDHVYCGVAQLFALSREYNIPIRVLYDYGKANQYDQTFNKQVNEGKERPLPILTIAHVNGNHFKFVSP